MQVDGRVTGARAGRGCGLQGEASGVLAEAPAGAKRGHDLLQAEETVSTPVRPTVPPPPLLNHDAPFFTWTGLTFKPNLDS